MITILMTIVIRVRLRFGYRLIALLANGAIVIATLAAALLLVLCAERRICCVACMHGLRIGVAFSSAPRDKGRIGGQGNGKMTVRKSGPSFR